MSTAPVFWKTSLDSIDAAVKKIHKGSARVLGKSAGNRSIWLIEYGLKTTKPGTANYCSALAAGNGKYYFGEPGKPVLLLVAGEHGGEMEGIAAIMNLISVLETGHDLRGKAYGQIENIANDVRILLIPCLNPDGRSRIPFDSMEGKTLQELRYYMQGTWKDGSLCDWPECKKVHPVLGAVDHLGAYYNDDGVNIMVDNVFVPMAQETKMLLQLAEQEMPSLTLHLHGGDNCHGMLMPPLFVENTIKERAQKLDRHVAERFSANNLPYYQFDKLGNEEWNKPMPFSIEHAIHHVCGGLSLVFENNMGLCEPGTMRCSLNEILDGHLLLFEEALKLIAEQAQEELR